MYSNAFRIANCSARLLEQRSFSLYFKHVVRLLSEKIAIPDPTPILLLQLSVYAYMECVPSSCPSIILTYFAGWVQFLTSKSLSYSDPLLFVIS